MTEGPKSKGSGSLSYYTPFLGHPLLLAKPYPEIQQSRDTPFRTLRLDPFVVLIRFQHANRACFSMIYVDFSVL